MPYQKILFIFSFLGVPPELSGTHNSEYVYKMGLSQIFDRVILTSKPGNAAETRVASKVKAVF